MPDAVVKFGDTVLSSQCPKFKNTNSRLGVKQNKGLCQRVI